MRSRCFSLYLLKHFSYVRDLGLATEGLGLCPCAGQPHIEAGLSDSFRLLVDFSEHFSD